MRLLCNRDKFGEYLDIDSGSVIYNEAILDNIGFYCIIHDCMCQFYVEDKKIFLKWKSNIYLINENSRSRVLTIKQTGENQGLKRFQLFEKYYLKTKIIIEFDYVMYFGYSFMNPFDNIIEPDEDWDWGFFLSNIINDKNRKKEFIKLKDTK